MRRELVLASALFCAGCADDILLGKHGTAPADPAAAELAIIPLYLVAPDTDPAVARERLAALGRAVEAVRGWYGERMGAGHGFATFRAPPPRALESRYTRAEWERFGDPDLDAGELSCGLWDAARGELTDDELAGAGLPPLGSAIYVVLAGAGSNGGCYAEQLSVIEELWADRVATRCPNGVYDAAARDCADTASLLADPHCSLWPGDSPGYACNFVGALAFDLGFGMGLVSSWERPAADQPACAGASIMDAWWEYGRSATLCGADQRDLARSPYVAAP